MLGAIKIGCCYALVTQNGPGVFEAANSDNSVSGRVSQLIGVKAFAAGSASCCVNCVIEGRLGIGQAKAINKNGSSRQVATRQYFLRHGA